MFLLPDGGCVDDQLKYECTGVGGLWFDGQACSGVTCPQP